MLKTIAILLNIIFIGCVFWMALTANSWEIRDTIIFLLLLLMPIINLFALKSSKDGWISLIFKRKALEEQEKIKNIEKKIK